MASYQYVYVMKNLSKTYPGGKTVLKDITLSFLPGVKIGILGTNGAGKSTLMKIMAGIDKDYNGEAWVADGARVGYLEQEPKLDPTLTVEQNVMLALKDTKALLDRYEEISTLLGTIEDTDEMMKLIEEQSTLGEKIEAANAWDLSRTVGIAMDALRCPPGDSPIDKLSGGEKRRVALAKLLLEKPDLLLLDEPTNHLDTESVAWLQRTLRDYPGTVALVTHDRYFLDEVTGWILEMDRGSGIPYEGNYTTWLEAKQKRLSQESREESAKQRVLSQELEWIRQTPKARQSKSKARVQSYEEMLANSKEQTAATAEIVIPTPPRLGTTVIEAKHLKKAFGDKLLIEDLSFSLPPGGIVGIIGPNGAGKTTLFKMITGVEQPDGGTFKVGETVHLGYVDQSRDALDANKNIWEEISGGSDVIELGINDGKTHNKRTVPSRAYVGAFGFKGTDQQKKVGVLSGGERNRVHLAKMLKSGANVLLLDEPTNDLDVDTLRALETALENFAGCAVVISHDRFFLDRLATHILAFEGDSQVVWFEGNYQEYELDLHRRKGTDADQPQAIKYKPITR